MVMQTKTLPLEYKVGEEAGARKITGYGSIFGNVDSYGDIVIKGAFAESIKKRAPKFLAQHDSDAILGRWMVTREDERGLYLEGEFARTPMGDEYYELAKMGAIDGLSIGYSTIDSDLDGDKRRLLKKINLWEVSLVTFPANELATLTGVKTLGIERGLEKYLRDAGGLSRNEAKKFISGGYQALGQQRDAEAEALQRAAASLAAFYQSLNKGY
jgi:HK97 family phage prohead protease